MKNTTSKWRFYLTIDREEQFLNEMCAKGWKPTEIILGIIFKFERCEPNEYIARVTCTSENKGQTKIKNSFITDTLIESGAEIIPEKLNLDINTRIYAIRKASLGTFEINTDKQSLISDYSSRIRMHKRASVILIIFFLLLIFEGIAFLVIDSKQMALVEFGGALIELLLMLPITLPIGKYKKLIKKLKSELEFSE